MWLSLIIQINCILIASSFTPKKISPKIEMYPPYEIPDWVQKKVFDYNKIPKKYKRKPTKAKTFDNNISNDEGEMSWYDVINNRMKF